MWQSAHALSDDPLNDSLALSFFFFFASINVHLGGAFLTFIMDARDRL
jgi:hypothetical protein